jgi:hypothetical protein
MLQLHWLPRHETCPAATCAQNVCGSKQTKRYIGSITPPRARIDLVNCIFFANLCILFHTFTLTRRMTVLWGAARETVVIYVCSKSPESKLLIWKWGIFFLLKLHFSSCLHYCSFNKWVWMSDISDWFQHSQGRTKRALGGSATPNRCGWSGLFSRLTNFSLASKQLYVGVIYHCCITTDITRYC